VEIVKDGYSTTTTDRRSILLRAGQSFVYDIYLVRYTVGYAGAAAGLVDQDFVSMALSTREADQQDIATAVPELQQARDKGIFARVGMFLQEATSGAAYASQFNEISFPKPFSVPRLAWLVDAGVSVTITPGVEVYFERRQGSKTELAQLLLEAGGKARTSPE